MTVKNYAVVVLDGISKGLFASLIVGTIIAQIGIISNIPEIETIGTIAKYCMGPCIGAGIAFRRGAKQFTLIAAVVAGAIGAGTIKFAQSGYFINIGEPVGAFIAAICAVEIGKLVEGKTKFDLLIVPAVVIATGAAVGIYVSPVIASALNKVGEFISIMTDFQPAIMGFLLGTAVGAILTLPISSAALCIAINIGGSTSSIAAGAALAGCCAQMVGFAVISFRENKFGGVLAQGLGTSMLQMPNIVKNPWIWLPPTLASGVCGILSSALFKMVTTNVGAGMGTSGLVGQFATYGAMGNESIIPMLILHFFVPVLICLPISEIMRKKGLIKPGDMSIYSQSTP